MKKLMTMVAAAATSLGLFAAVDFTTSVNSDLSARNPGDTNIVGVDDDGEGTGNIHWWDDAYTASGYESPAVVSNSDDTAIGNYLAVETDGSPLLRTFGKVTVGQETAQYDAVNIADHGLFIQTKVCLTAFEDDESIEQKLDGNKLLVWLKATETENDVEGVTNLMVTCGSWSEGSMTPVSYALDNVDVEPGQWVTLTIRADKDTTDNVPKFQIFVGEGEQAVQAKAGAMDEFPSLIGGAANLTLKAAGFDGNGSVNFVNLLTPADAPAFAADATTVAITWGDHVTSVKIAGADIDPTVPYVVTAFGEDITATITYEEGYRRASVTPNGFADGCFTEDIAKNQFTFSVARYANASVEIAAELDRNEAGLVINGETVGTFSSLAAAFAKIKEVCPTYNPGDTAVIKMNEDASADDFGFDDEINPDVTIDLNGHTIECTNQDSEFYAFDASGALKIIDSSDLGGGKIIGNIYADFSLDILEAAQDIVIDGDIDYCLDTGYEAEVVIERAKVTDPITGEFVQLGKKGEDMEWDGPDKDGFYTLVEAADNVAKIGDVEFATVADALEAAKNGDKIELLTDVALDAYVKIKKTITFDLGGWTLSSTKGVFDVYAQGVVIQNGAVNPTDGCGVWVNPNATATVAESVTITVPATAASNRAGVAAQGAATVNVLGKIVQNGPGSAIAGLGNAGDAGSEIQIGATAVIESAGAGIYFPVTGGTLKILEGASITAAGTAVEVKAGRVVIGKATIATTTAIDAATHVKNNNGNSTTGYALAIVENKAYGDHIDIQVGAGAKFAGKVGIVIDDEDAPAPDEITILSGALFTDKAGAATLIDAETQQMAEEADAEGYFAVEAKKGGDIPTDPEKDITDDTKPEDIGLNPAGPFKDAKKDELIKLSKWANKAGVKAADINAGMTFGEGGAPVSLMADAYLLDCTPAQLTEAKAAFKFNAEDLAAAMAGTENPKTFADKTYNGTIVIKAFLDVACKTPAEDEAAAKFYKAFLVK